MPRHDGSKRHKTRKERKRRGRNRQSWLDQGNEPKEQVRRRKASRYFEKQEPDN